MGNSLVPKQEAACDRRGVLCLHIVGLQTIKTQKTPENRTLSRFEAAHNSLRKLLQALPFQNRFTIAQSVFDVRYLMHLMRRELREGMLTIVQ